MAKATLKAKISADATDFNRTLKSLKKQALNAGQQIGDNLKKAGLALGLVLARSAQVFASFEEKMQAVRAVTNATNQDFEKLKRKAEDLGKTTSFSASQVADGMKFLGQAGLTTNQILEGIPVALKLARAGALELGVAADIITDIGTAFDLTADKFEHLGDVLAKGASSSTTDINQISEAMKMVAGSANKAGVSIEQTTAALGMLANAGMKGTMAGTALNQLLVKLTDGATQKKLKNMFGVTVLDGAGNLRSLVDITKDLSGTMKNLTGAEQLKLINEMFDVRAGRAFLAMMKEQGNAFEGLNKKVANANGALTKMSNIMDKGTTGEFKKFLSALEGLQIAIGKALKKDIDSLLKSLTDFVNFLTKVINENKELAKVLGKAAIGAVALGTALTSIGTLAGVLSFIKNLNTAIKALSVSQIASASNTKILTASLSKIPQVAAAAGVAVGGLAVGNEIGKALGTEAGGDMYLRWGQSLGILTKELENVDKPIQQLIDNKKKHAEAAEKANAVIIKSVEVQQEEKKTIKELQDILKKRKKTIEEIAALEKKFADDKKKAEREKAEAAVESAEKQVEAAKTATKELEKSVKFQDDLAKKAGKEVNAAADQTKSGALKNWREQRKTARQAEREEARRQRRLENAKQRLARLGGDMTEKGIEETKGLSRRQKDILKAELKRQKAIDARKGLQNNLLAQQKSVLAQQDILNKKMAAVAHLDAVNAAVERENLLIQKQTLKALKMNLKNFNANLELETTNAHLYKIENFMHLTSKKIDKMAGKAVK